LYGAYVWYALAAGMAARALGSPGWRYVVWILAAPFVALIVALLPIPLLSSAASTVISVSPLSIKFLLGNQLEEAFRRETSLSLHR
jgi:hypothetical protein